MTESEKILMFCELGKNFDEPPTDETALAYLTAAKWRVLNRMYPFGIHDEAKVPERYAMLQVEIAFFLFNKQGMEGQTSHAENGVSRVFGGADVPEALMQQITPRGMVL